MTNRTKKTHIVIPYIQSEAQGTELELSVAGWRKHAMFPYIITIVGDYHKVVDTGDDIEFIRQDRITEAACKGEYRPCIDQWAKFSAFMANRPEVEGFIYTCDDIYTVNDVTLQDIMEPKILREEMWGCHEALNGWLIALANSQDELKGLRLPTREYVCHMPVYFNTKLLSSIYSLYDCKRTAHIVEDLYYNTFRSSLKEHAVGEALCNEWRLRCTGDRLSCEEIERNIETFRTRWIYNSVDGWNESLKQYLTKALL